jgi:hypothetical protein
MGLRGVIGLTACWLIAGTAVLQASETGPVIVIPSRPGVPIIVDGQDISGAVIEGDWGLARPGQISPRVIYRYNQGALIGPAPAAYFPKTGRAPKVGRKEVDVPRAPEKPDTFFRSFGVQSDPTPVTPPGTQQQMPIIVAPQVNPGHHP